MFQYEILQRKRSHGFVKVFAIVNGIECQKKSLYCIICQQETNQKPLRLLTNETCSNIESCLTYTQIIPSPRSIRRNTKKNSYLVCPIDFSSMARHTPYFNPFTNFEAFLVALNLASKFCSMLTIPLPTMGILFFVW